MTINNFDWNHLFVNSMVNETTVSAKTIYIAGLNADWSFFILIVIKVAINHLIIYRFLCFSDYITVHTTGVTGHQRLRTSLWHILLPLFCRGPFLCCLFFVFFLCTFLILNTVWYHQVFFRCILRRKTIFKSNLETHAHTFRKYFKLHVIC